MVPRRDVVAYPGYFRLSARPDRNGVARSRCSTAWHGSWPRHKAFNIIQEFKRGFFSISSAYFHQAIFLVEIVNATNHYNTLLGYQK